MLRVAQHLDLFDEMKGLHGKLVATNFFEHESLVCQNLRLVIITLRRLDQLVEAFLALDVQSDRLIEGYGFAILLLLVEDVCDGETRSDLTTVEGDGFSEMRCGCVPVFVLAHVLSKVAPDDGSNLAGCWVFTEQPSVREHLLELVPGVLVVRRHLHVELTRDLPLSGLHLAECILQMGGEPLVVLSSVCSATQTINVNLRFRDVLEASQVLLKSVPHNQTSVLRSITFKLVDKR